MAFKREDQNDEPLYQHSGNERISSTRLTTRRSNRTFQTDRRTDRHKRCTNVALYSWI